jgi:hypothetical protein
MTDVLSAAGFAIRAGHRLRVCRSAGEGVALLALALDGEGSALRGDGRWVEDVVLTHLMPQDILGHGDSGRYLLLSAGADRKAAVGRAERMRVRLFTHGPSLGNEGRTLSLSVGLAWAERAPSTLELLVRLAVQGLYEARWAGGNRVVSLAWPVAERSGVPDVVGPSPRGKK